MNDLKVGQLIRAVRRRRRLRQIDLAAAVHVSQQTVSLIERGHLGSFALDTTRAIATYLEIDLPFAPRYRGAEGDRLLDERHAALVEAVCHVLRQHGWSVRVEYSYSVYGERGSVDVLAWHAETLVIIVFEIKTEIVDVQALVRSTDTKCRLVPPLLAKEIGWKTFRPGRVLVLPDDRTARFAVDRHASTFAAAFPGRTVDVRRSLQHQTGPRDPGNPPHRLDGIWFLNPTSGIGGTPKRQSPHRVRRSQSRENPAGGPAADGRARSKRGRRLGSNDR